MYDDDSHLILRDDETVIDGEVWNTKPVNDPVFMCETDGCDHRAIVRLSANDGDGISRWYLCQTHLLEAENAE